MRIGDRERDAAVSKLQDFHAEGRLNVEEFEERMASALTAKTAADLSKLFTDLPGGQPSQYGPDPENPYANMPYQAGYQAPPTYQPPGYQPPAQYAVPTPYQPVPVPAPERPWYAQWWMLFVAIGLTAFTRGSFGPIVPLMAIWIWAVYPSIARSRQRSSHPPHPPRELTFQERDQVMMQITAGRKVEAIRLYRQMTGADLVTAKHIIDAWSRGLPGA